MNNKFIEACIVEAEKNKTSQARKDASRKNGELGGRPPRYKTRTYVVKEGSRFRLCKSKRTPKGPRRIKLVSLGCNASCQTILGAIDHWTAFLRKAQADCKAICEKKPETYKIFRQWQRAAKRCDRARARLKAIHQYI